MSKIMSMFEKLNLVEKVDSQVDDVPKTVNSKIVEQAEIKKDEADKIEVDIKACEPVNEGKQANIKMGSRCDSNKTIKEIYSSYDMENSDVNTIFMLGNFINALPDNLPYEVRKQSVMNIIQASKTDFRKLISDGEKRLDILNQFGKEYHNSTIYKIDEHKAEIIRLNNLINSYKEEIYIKETMLEEQNNIIKYEAEKIGGIINFFENGD